MLDVVAVPVAIVVVPRVRFPERATTFDIMDEDKKNKLLELLGKFAVGVWAKP